MRTFMFIAPLALVAAACGSTLDASPSASRQATPLVHGTRGIGDGCVVDADCGSPELACQDALCVPNTDPRGVGEVCGVGLHCAPGLVCSDSLCMPAGDSAGRWPTLDVGSACTADADCQSSILGCVDAVCTLTCDPAVPGSDCAVDTDCCNPNLVCADAVCVPNSDPEGSAPPPEGTH